MTFIPRKNAHNITSPLHSDPKQTFKKAPERKASEKRKIGDLRGREGGGGGVWKIVRTSGKILATPLMFCVLKSDQSSLTLVNIYTLTLLSIISKIDHKQATF